MEIIDLTVNNQTVICSCDTSMVAGEVGVHAVRVSYDDAWSAAASRVLCFSGPSGSAAVMDNGGETPVPCEVVQQPGMLEIGVVGYDKGGTLVITTHMPYASRIRIRPNSSGDSDIPPPEPPTPSIFDQVLGSIGRLDALKTIDKSNLVAAINEVLGRVGTGGGGGGVDFTTDETLSLVDGVLRVNTAGAVEQDNTLPITSAAVHTTVGNIEMLLGTI